MNISNYGFVIFDGDDTLWQTTALYDKAREEFCAWLVDCLKSHAFDPVASTAEISAYQQARDKELFKVLGYSSARFPRSFEETARFYLGTLEANELIPYLRAARLRGERVFSERAVPYPGVERLLRSLKKRGIQIGLLTAGEWWVQEKRLQDFPWRGLFDWVKIVSDADGAAPKQGELLNFQERHPNLKNRILVVGDSFTSDIVPSLKVGIDALWIAHANWDREQEHNGTEVEKNQAALGKKLAEFGLESVSAAVVEGVDSLAEFLSLDVADDSNSSSDVPLFTYAVFEGGGAKGLAHVGALKACENRNIVFIGAAGTSSGSMIAGLIAAGYSADEIFGAQGGLLRSKDYSEFIGQDEWSASKSLADVVAKIVRQISQAHLMRAVYTIYQNSGVINKAIDNSGVIDTAQFRRWYNECLSKKVFPGQPVRDVTFAMIGKAFNDRLQPYLENRKDLEKIYNRNGSPLKIVATDVSERAVAVYPDDGSEDMVVADAVAASIAIPFVFRPKTLNIDSRDRRHVDGGALANFPVWSLQNRIGRYSEVVPLLGFRLEDKSGGGAADTFGDYVQQLLATVVAGSARIAKRGVDDFFEVSIPVSVGTFDFDMPEEKKVRTFQEGFDAARGFFITPNASLLVTQEQMSPKLEKLRREMLDRIGRPNAHLRINVIAQRPPGSTLHVRYHSNMEFDSDDHLELDDQLGGGAGISFRTGETRFVDLADARSTYSRYRMTKVEQALIRRSLTSLLCVPVFDPRDRKQTDLALKRKLGVLNFDSDDDLHLEFSDPELIKFADSQAADLALFWIELTYRGRVS